MADVDDLNLLPGSHTYSVARLDIGEMHSVSRSLEERQLDELSETIAVNRRNLSHAATSVLNRIKEKLPKRRYRVNTGVMVADNRLFVCAVIERIK